MLRYAITDRRLLAPDETGQHEALLRQAAELARSGRADFLLLREKDLSPRPFLALARDLRATLETHAPDPAFRPRLLIHTHAKIALAVRADGVHLSSTARLTPAEIRTSYRDAHLPAPIISLSCHTLDTITRAATDSRNAPDLILFGPVFEKCVYGELIAPGTGLDPLAKACRRAAPIPVLALGGVTAANTPACLAAGAAGIAAIRLFQNLPA